MIRYFRTPYFVKRMYRSLTWETQDSNAIHLTFDDGPNATVTPWVLDELEKVGGRGTFFCIGENVSKNKELIQQMANDGHLIANHTYNHINGKSVRDSTYLSNVQQCSRALEQVGIQNNFFRPPYGNIKRSQIQSLHGMKIIMWSHLSYDFDPKLNVEKSIAALKKVKPGSIIVFHDSPKAFENLRLILPALLSYYHFKGFKMEALS